MMKRNDLKKNWVYIILTLCISIATISIYIFWEGGTHTTKVTNSFESFYIQEQSLAVKNEVESRYDEITYELVRLQDDQKKLLESKIHSMASAMRCQPFANDLLCEDKQSCFIKAMEEYVSYDDSLYFVLSPAGVLLRSGTDEGIEGIDISNNVDIEGNFYTQEMLEAVNNPDGVYVSYYWPKEKDGEPLKKISYCYYLEEFDLIVGTGAYYEDMESELKERVLDRLQYYYEGEDNYVFVIDYNGTIYVHGDQDSVGTDFSTYIDTNGVSPHSEIMSALEQDFETYVTYHFKDTVSENVTEKVSYVLGIDNWNVYLGMGFHTDRLIEASDQFLEDYNREHIHSTVITIAMLVLTGFIIVILVKRGLSNQNTYLKQEDIVYEQVLNKANDLIIVLGSKSDVLFVNKKFPYDLSIDQFIQNGELNLDRVKNDVYILHGEKHAYYVEMKSSFFHYQGQDARIYYIKDITQQFEEANSMEKLALHDELTGLPNRRKLLKDLTEDCLYDCDQCNLTLALIDIDYFKNINDKNGHDFGDHILKDLASYVKKQLREKDTFYRYGGEEFIVIFREFEANDAKRRLEDINIGFSAYIKTKRMINISFSGGVVSCNCKRDKTSANECIKKADELLYMAKNQGRNRILSE